jgi:heme/copper-type cytochrome/quinol oxidase subunit 1
MALTDTRPEAAAPGVPAAPTAADDRVGAALGSGDHKVVGRLYLVTALVLFLAVTIAATALGFERIDQTDFQLFSRDTYFQFSTLQATSMVFMVLVPLLLGLAIYIVPLQIGARAITFPRASAASFWGYLVGSGMVIGSYGINGGPGGGDAVAVDLWLVSFAFLVVSLLLGTVCVVTTIVVNRTPGMSLYRVPLFTWSMLVAGVVWITTLSVLVAVLIVAYVDHRYGRTIFGNFDLYPYVHWVLRAPQVYAFAIPALGIVAEIVPVMGRARQAQHRLMMAAFGAFGVLGIGAYTVTFYVPGHDIYGEWMWIGTGIAVVLPVLALLGGWADTMRRGSPRLHSSLLFAGVGTLVLLLGTLAGAATVIEPFHLAGTTWETGQADLVLFATLMIAIGGLHYWAPKIGGRFLGEGLGRLVTLVFFAGVLLLAGGNLVAGVLDQVDHLLIASTDGFTGIVVVRDNTDIGNGAATLGAAVLVLGALGVLVNVLASSMGPADDVADDPWDGHTLEWATTSPPPPNNFDEVALVTSATPVLDDREPADDEDAA